MDLVGKERRAGTIVWVLRGLTVLMLVVGIGVASRKFQPTAEQEELERYVDLTVPGYLEEVAAVHERFARLVGGASIEPAAARAQIVDEITPMLVRLRKHALAVKAVSPSVKERNVEFVAAVDAYIALGRVSVQAIDEPAAAAEERARRVREGSRAADEAMRQWMVHLRESCARAGFKVKL